MTDIADLLEKAMKEHDPPFSQLGLSHKLGMMLRGKPFEGNAVVGMVLARKRAIPAEDIETWAEALELTGEKKSEFILTANLEISTVFVREFVRRTLAAERHHRQDLDRLNRKLNEALASLENRDRTIRELRKRLARYESVA